MGWCVHILRTVTLHCDTLSLKVGGRAPQEGPSEILSSCNLHAFRVEFGVIAKLP